MKEGTFMEQTLLIEVQNRLSQLKELKEEIDATQKQFAEKEQEIQEFYQNWKSNCPHAFYRVQRVIVCTTVTKGYYCCLCGTYQPAQYPPSPSPRRPRNYIEKCRQKAKPPVQPHADINAPNFIGTVIESVYADGKSQEERYPIPPEYQAMVDSKEEKLCKLKSDKSTIEKKLQSLKNTVNLSETELDEIAHLLNGYFHYPEVVYEKPFHWGSDDFNYDPFD